MRYFPGNNGYWATTKVNFVDENNVLVGYDFGSNCCESFGWYISDKLTTDFNDCLYDENISDETLNESLKDWTFDKSFFEELSPNNPNSYNEDNRVAFRLVNGDKELFLHLYNIHNGYYSHGFEFSEDGKSLQAGYL
jgi:hypothetical protein